ncbi:hypothetical protein P7K49_008074 [Saguinus oedipus]|uniref:Uncharacterized protein n=1 Tax=Saguinus oedipus TaxID=9490 RepID=A0ABQ9VWM4_SAGOE|nr:hypothetical protein P7K49_008074 [Saguinus oedipus]
MAFFAMGNRMTFVTEEEGINVFLKSKKVDFEQAVQNLVYRTASIPKNVFLALHEKLYIMLKGKMGTVNLHQFAGQLTEELHEQLESLGTHGTMDLNNLVRHLLYPVTVNTLFNKSLFPTNKKKIKEFHQHFQAYDEDFEYGSQLPESLLRNWSKSKKWLLELLEKNIPDIKACTSAKDNSMLAVSITLLQATLDIVETVTSKENSPSYGLLLLWASLSNAVPYQKNSHSCQIINFQDLIRNIPWKKDTQSPIDLTQWNKDTELSSLPLLSFVLSSSKKWNGIVVAASAVRLHFGHLHTFFLIPMSTKPLWKAYLLCLAQQITISSLGMSFVNFQCCVSLVSTLTSRHFAQLSYKTNLKYQSYDNE